MLASLVAVVEGRLRGHGDADLASFELHPVEPLESGVGGAGLLVLDDAVALGLAGGVVLVDPHGERPLVLVAPLLLEKKTRQPNTHPGRGYARQEARERGLDNLRKLVAPAVQSITSKPPHTPITCREVDLFCTSHLTPLQVVRSVFLQTAVPNFLAQYLETARR